MPAGRVLTIEWIGCAVNNHPKESYEKVFGQACFYAIFIVSLRGVKAANKRVFLYKACNELVSCLLYFRTIA
jgi:hypothetical protein